jgi:hypothetical protein
MDQENVVFLYNGIFFSHKEELNFVICKYMDRIGEHHLKRGYPGAEGQYRPSCMWNIDLIQMQQFYEKQVTLRAGHVQEGEGKRRKLRM